MADLVEDTKGKIRDLPIDGSLKKLLVEAATRSGIDRVRVTSGGQAAKGTPGKRTGSTRHDLGRAADLEIWKGNRALSFVRPEDLPFFRSFVTEATALGATGIGAGTDYMGPLTMHVGYGAEAYWGKAGLSAFVPTWLKEAVLAGRLKLKGKKSAAPVSPASTPSPPPSVPRFEYIVVARSGLNLRSGPDKDYPIVSALAAGSHVWSDFAGSPNEWARVDLENDGLFDGFVCAAYLVRV